MRFDSRTIRELDFYSLIRRYLFRFIILLSISLLPLVVAVIIVNHLLFEVLTVFVSIIAMYFAARFFPSPSYAFKQIIDLRYSIKNRDKEILLSELAIIKRDLENEFHSFGYILEFDKEEISLKYSVKIPKENPKLFKKDTGEKEKYFEEINVLLDEKKEILNQIIKIEILLSHEKPTRKSIKSYLIILSLLKSTNLINSKLLSVLIKIKH